MGQIEAAFSREEALEAEVARLLAILEQAGLEPDGSPAGLVAASRLTAQNALDRLRKTQNAAAEAAAFHRRSLADGRAELASAEALNRDLLRANAALRESEERFRTLADSAPALIWTTDADGRITFANRHYETLFDRPAGDILGDGWMRIVHPDDLDRFHGAFLSAFAQRLPFKAEVRVRDHAGRTRWLRCEGVPRYHGDGLFLGYTGCNIDITDGKVAEEHREFLIGELNHRVKNILANVQSIAFQTLRNADGLEAARASLEARLLALGGAQDVLTRENWTSAGIRAVLASALSVHAVEGGPERIRSSGPDIRLSPRAALALAMMAHELGTNAIKYGALSNESGRVDLAWSVETLSDGARFRFNWTERDGPPVRPPARKGFGSRLIERGLAGDRGDVRLAFAPEGVVCAVDAPLAAVQD
ncbi:MAG TPA: HWE histidine kinase domain-containing protein [Microvirga sp.]|jgi:PAS domain S-box-containing protein|nr:HWE histidine kinase domain-containing protein [Microvirga sp.]